MKLTEKEKQAVAALAESEGWRIIEGLLNEVLASHVRRLQVERFTDLAEIARLQGEITGMTRVLDFVNNRQDQKERGQR